MPSVYVHTLTGIHSDPLAQPINQYILQYLDDMLHVLVVESYVWKPQITGLGDNKLHIIILRSVPSKSVVIPVLVTQRILFEIFNCHIKCHIKPLFPTSSSYYNLTVLYLDTVLEIFQPTLYTTIPFRDELFCYFSRSAEAIILFILFSSL